MLYGDENLLPKITFQVQLDLEFLKVTLDSIVDANQTLNPTPHGCPSALE